MKFARNTVIGLVVTVSLVCFSALAVFSEEQPKNDSETRYTYVIDKEIERCQQKIALKNSRSTNLQREAAKSSMKAAFLKDYKNELIAEMKREDIGAKDYQIRSFLNEKFFDVLSPIFAGSQYNAEEIMAVER